MLINGLLYNSEAWHSVSKQEIISLEKIDESLLRFLLGSHAKVPLEILYLESAAVPINCNFLSPSEFPSNYHEKN